MDSDLINIKNVLFSRRRSGGCRTYVGGAGGQPSGQQGRGHGERRRGAGLSLSPGEI
jgi:hypothetical protein